jgi:TolB-like protein/tetratricopeptide (TPR) repeat protein
VDPEAPSLLQEMKRRRVFRALVGYGIAAFAVLQIIEPVMHGLHWPEAVLSYVVAALAVGFPVVVSLAWIFDVNAGRIERTASSRLRGPRLAALLVGVGALAAAPGLIYWFVVRQKPAAVQAAPSIAALPLVNLSRDPDQEYFADGLTEEMLNLLARVPGLHVAGRTSSFAFKGKSEDLRSIGQKLGVATVLEGSVQKAGDRVRITVQLINAADGYHLWSEAYDRKLTDVFAVQDEIARSVVSALRPRLLPEHGPGSKERQTSNPDAHAQYLLGRQLFNRRNDDGFRRAVQAFDKALALDSGFAPAWAGLALAAYWDADSNAANSAALENGYRRALAAAEKAVQLGPELAEAYEARANLRATMEWDWAGAAADFERALALSPENADIRRAYAGLVLASLGRLPEAITALRAVTAADPLNSRAWGGLGTILLMSGQVRPAREALDRSLEINPDDRVSGFWLSAAGFLEHDPTAALGVAQRSASEWIRFWGAAIAYHALGQASKAQETLDLLIRKYGHLAAFQIAETYAWRGDKERAFAWLERAFAQHDGGLTLIKIDPFMGSLRGDPRYLALLKKMNLPP